MLHPEKFLFERRKIVRDVIVTEETLVEMLREEHGRKEAREVKLNSDTSKTVF